MWLQQALRIMPYAVFLGIKRSLEFPGAAVGLQSLRVLNIISAKFQAIAAQVSSLKIIFKEKETVLCWGKMPLDRMFSNRWSLIIGIQSS